jgi:hypothetical protein
LRKVVVGARDRRRVRDELQLLLGSSDLFEVRDGADDGIEELVLEDENGGLVIK